MNRKDDLKKEKKVDDHGEKLTEMLDKFDLDQVSGGVGRAATKGSDDPEGPVVTPEI